MTVYYIKCGTPNPDYATYCIRCGQPLVKSDIQSLQQPQAPPSVQNYWQQESIKVLFLLVGDIEWHARSLIITDQRVLLTNVITDKDISGVDATVAGVLAGIGATIAASLLGVLPGVGGMFGTRIAQSMRKSKIYDAARQMKQLFFEFSNPVPLSPNLKVKKSYLISELRKVRIYTPKGGDYTEIVIRKSTWSSIDAQVPLVNPQDIHNVLLKYLPSQLIETNY
ncbi:MULTISPECIES: zinc ribbon domain-containing protein [unclassified Stygiolobus]|uniref:zinc ribbon domain-containing protein n=1 Tax=unclassified Stygiolobus TaxID=2824672 RepID=UPI00307DC5F7